MVNVRMTDEGISLSNESFISASLLIQENAELYTYNLLCIYVKQLLILAD